MSNGLEKVKRFKHNLMSICQGTELKFSIPTFRTE